MMHIRFLIHFHYFKYSDVMTKHAVPILYIQDGPYKKAQSDKKSRENGLFFRDKRSFVKFV